MVEHCGKLVLQDEHLTDNKVAGLWAEDSAVTVEEGGPVLAQALQAGLEEANVREGRAARLCPLGELCEEVIPVHGLHGQPVVLADRHDTEEVLAVLSEGIDGLTQHRRHCLRARRREGKHCVLLVASLQDHELVGDGLAAGRLVVGLCAAAPGETGRAGQALGEVVVGEREALETLEHLEVAVGAGLLHRDLVLVGCVQELPHALRLRLDARGESGEALVELGLGALVKYGHQLAVVEVLAAKAVDGGDRVLLELLHVPGHVQALGAHMVDRQHLHHLRQPPLDDALLVVVMRPVLPQRVQRCHQFPKQLQHRLQHDLSCGVALEDCAGDLGASGDHIDAVLHGVLEVLREVVPEHLVELLRPVCLQGNAHLLEQRGLLREEGPLVEGEAEGVEHVLDVVALLEDANVPEDCRHEGLLPRAVRRLLRLDERVLDVLGLNELLLHLCRVSWRRLVEVQRDHLLQLAVGLCVSVATQFHYVSQLPRAWPE
mmetsp:Transcript_18516/g.71487  ORF Transcript_18516/g.71487 Transcript_18516/m.71487 type:complete len:489 (-) Transcript_18516:3-1469(-)